MRRVLNQIGSAAGCVAVVSLFALFFFGVATWAVAIFAVSFLVWITFARGALLATLIGAWLGSR